MFGQVISVVRLSPTMVRVVLGGGDLQDFEPSAATDAYDEAWREVTPDWMAYAGPDLASEMGAWVDIADV